MELQSPEKEVEVFHFSHPHALKLTTSPPTKGNASCFGCKLDVRGGKSYYHCESCDFRLHYFCYKLPIVTHHPAHSSHDVVLLVIRPSPAVFKGAIKCAACGLHVTAFCYHCAECSNIYFHTFCLALPLSLFTTVHPHSLKLEFSPPYDFFCDLCKKPSFKGWLYRCSLCEFDIHLACAVQNLEPHSIHLQSFSQLNSLLRKLANVSDDGDTNSGNSTISCSVGCEIMHLIAEQIGAGIIRRSNNDGKEDVCSAIIGWDNIKRISSPVRGNGKKAKMIELQEETEAKSGGNLEDRTPLRDSIMTPCSDVSTPGSYQFSEACFSIDLTKSTPESRSGISEGKGGGGSSSRSFMISNNNNNVNSGEVVVGKEVHPFGIVNWPSFNSYNETGQQNNTRLIHASSIYLNGGSSSQKPLKPTISNSDSVSSSA